ncbi:hypothetical protein [Deinococcus ruber]|uniref:Uncharacterized protein n=1 Tax=Deinococcus ruber TaxID=1848197 RepID=A0A918FAW6_9DEIO|nr:hypothetical protein [Deinococcus ruber]GGR17544.1 hypothetical protein GCM10008957_32880 [Deinococcus ruber]
MDNAWNDRFERLITLAARHMPQRPDIREREWLSLFDESPTLDSKVHLTLGCLAMASGGLLRGALLKLARGVLILTVIAVPGIWHTIAADWTVLPALGIFMLLLLPSLQRQPFDARWYPALTWPTWIWRTSAAAWLLLFLSAVFVAHAYAFALSFAAVMVMMYGWDADRLIGRPAAHDGP